jgi:beta-glucosidase
LPRPEKELKGFAKVFLNAGESKEIDVALGTDAFQYYDDKKKMWTLEPGKFTLLVGTSSSDIKFTDEVTF